MRSPRDSRDRTDEETRDRNLGCANTFKRVNTGWTARDWESSQPDRKISYLHRLPRQQRWGMHSWPQHPRQLNQDICQIHVAKESGCHPNLSSSPRCNGSALLNCGGWDRGLTPGAVCCGDKDLFSRGRKKAKHHQGQSSVNVHNDPNLRFRETGERTRKVKGFTRWIRQSWHSNS